MKCTRITAAVVVLLVGATVLVVLYERGRRGLPQAPASLIELYRQRYNDDFTFPPGGLTTEVREKSTEWDSNGWPIKTDLRWRLLSSRQTNEGIEVTGSWEITVTNKSTDDAWEFNLGRLTFADWTGLQVTEYRPTGYVLSRELEAEASFTGQGNFQFTVDRIELANSITSVNLWASAEKK